VVNVFKNELKKLVAIKRSVAPQNLLCTYRCCSLQICLHENKWGRCLLLVCMQVQFAWSKTSHCAACGIFLLHSYWWI